MVHLSPEDGDAALAQPGVRPMDFTGKPMKGFIYVGAQGVKTDRMLKNRVSQGVAFASSLPPKKPKSSAGRTTARSAKR